MTKSVHTRTCHLCEAICGVLMTVEDGKVTRIEGDKADPLSLGHICPKGAALADIQDDPDRLSVPLKKVGATWQQISWDQAFDEVASRLCDLIDTKGPDSIGFYIGNPSAHNLGWLTLGRYFPKATQTNNIFSASTVDQRPHELVNLWMYGHHFLMPIADIDRTDVMLMLGANPLASNGSIWTVPGVKERIRQLQKRGGKLIVVDPRRTETVDVADEHISIRPGHDAPFLIGLLLALDEAKLVKPAHLEPLLEGWDLLWARLREFSLPWCERASGVPQSTIVRIASLLGEAKHAVVYGRIGVSHSLYGALNQWLIHLLNIATGNLDKEGGAMFAEPALDLVKASPPAKTHRWHSRVSKCPEMLGDLPVFTLAEEIMTPGDGQIRALVTVAGNPVLSTPNGQQLDAAFASLDFMVSIDPYITETTRHAHYILPPAGPLERSHYPIPFFMLSVRNVAKYSPALFERPETSRHDFEISDALARQIATRRGVTLPPPMTPEQVLELGFAISGRGVTLQMLKDSPHGIDLGPLRPCLPQRLKTPSQKIHCAPKVLMLDLDRLANDQDLINPGQELRLIGRRHLRSNNSWMHNIPRLIKGPERCTLLIHPQDARARNLANGAMAKVTSRVGSIEVVVEVSDEMMPGIVSIPHGYGHERGGVNWKLAALHQGASINDLTDERRFDPVSFNAALSGLRVSVTSSGE